MNIQFHIYGDGVQKRSIQNFTKQNPNNIFLHDSVSKDEIQKKLLQFDATIIPLKRNIYGAFPSKISMAMSSALPIFFAGDGEGFEFVNEHNFGYTSKAGDIKGLTNNIKTFSQLDSDDIIKMKSKIIKTVREKFDYQQQQLELFKFININIIESKKDGFK